ncbi:MAG TPA: hypothetical protein PLC38_06625 [Methanobacterium sp.]|jgi:hypothetical protein|nr:hypothetical protein [Methanobacterium sp.]
MANMEVNVAEYGFSEENRSYYVTYQVANLDPEEIGKLTLRLEDPVVVKSGDLFLTVYFQEKYYPFKSEEAKRNPEDFIAREELEMTAYLLDLLED